MWTYLFLLSVWSVFATCILMWYCEIFCTKGVYSLKNLKSSLEISLSSVTSLNWLFYLLLLQKSFQNWTISHHVHFNHCGLNFQYLSLMLLHSLLLSSWSLSQAVHSLIFIQCIRSWYSLLKNSIWLPSFV